MARKTKADNDDLVENFIAVVKSSIILQLGILIFFTAISFVIVVGGGIKVMGFNIIESEVSNIIESEVSDEVYKDHEENDKLDTLEIK
tara:strand:- start:148 stop:411 length:264 start_codon:yes stop_codon:yes gene_type:complete